MVKNNGKKVLLIREFAFTVKPEKLYPLLNEMVDAVRAAIASKFSAAIETRCKMIITELLTNALKHSNVSQSLLTLVIENNRISIAKSDSGTPFHLAEWMGREAMQWPIDDSFAGKEIIIYDDDMCRLRGFVEHQNKLTFLTEDLPVVIPPRPKNLLEHFGLMILTKSSDEFIYQYDPESRFNIFQASILI